MNKKLLKIGSILSFVALCSTLLGGCKNKPTEEEKFMKSLNIQYVEKYLYEIEYDSYDYSYAKTFFENYKIPLGGCSSVQNGTIRGRNYDWYYNDEVAFILRTPAKNGKHEVIGIASAGSITEEVVRSGNYAAGYKILPFLLQDGINDEGLIANINVLPYGDSTYKYSGMNTETLEDDLTGIMIVRYLLDNAGSIEEATELLSKIDYFPMSSVQDLHYMVSGKTSSTDSTLKTVVYEFLPNEEGHYKLNVIDSFVDNKAIMTNFQLTGYDGTEESITPHGMGIERYDILKENYTMGSTKRGMLDLMKKVYYTKAYDLYSDNFWYSEFFAGELTRSNRGDKALNGDTSKAGAYTNTLNTVSEWYKQGNRGNYIWQTVHTSVYDFSDKSLSIMVQEGSIVYNYKLD